MLGPQVETTAHGGVELCFLFYIAQIQGHLMCAQKWTAVKHVCNEYRTATLPNHGQRRVWPETHCSEYRTYLRLAVIGHFIGARRVN